METSTESARKDKAMHPLWKEYVLLIISSSLHSFILVRRYVFPADPHSGVIDLTDERPFYFNEYSGELSLEFPVSERKFRGGILA